MDDELAYSFDNEQQFWDGEFASIPRHCERAHCIRTGDLTLRATRIG